jgi:hypothetical protein
MSAGSPSKARRVIALAVGALLIIGGVAGLTSVGGLAVSKIGAAVAIVAGLVFLGISARSKTNA